MPIEVAGVVARLGFRVDDDGANRFERKVRDLRGDAKRDVVVPLKGDLQPRDLDLYDKKLREIRAKVRRREDFKAQLGADFDPKAFNAYERESRRVVKSTDDNVRAQGRLRTAFGSVSSAGVGMFAAAGGGYAIYAGLKSIVTASGDAEASLSKVRTMVENAGIDFDKHADKIDRTIQAHSRLSGFDDEELAESFGNMIRTTGDLNEAFRLNAIAADIARTKGTDLAGAQSLVARVSNGAFMGLKRLGLSIDPVTKAQDKLKESTAKYTDAQMASAKEADKTATSRKAIALLEKTFAGQSEAYGKTQMGAIDRLKVAWENLQEVLGKKLAPTVTDIANKLAKFVTGMAEGRGEGGRFVEKMKEVWEEIKRVGGVVLDVGGFLKDHIRLVGLAAGAWVSYKAAVKTAAAVQAASGLIGAIGGRGRRGGGVGAAGAVGGIGAGAALGGPVGIGVAAAGIGLTAAQINAMSRGEKATAGLAKMTEHLGKLARTSSRDYEALRNVIDKVSKQQPLTRKENELWTKTLHDMGIKGKTSVDKLLESWKDLRRESQKTFKGEELKDYRKHVRTTVSTSIAEWDRLKKDGGANLKDIRDRTRSTGRFIRQQLPEDTAVARKAVSDNFKRARGAIRDAMAAGKVDTKEGSRLIREYMVKGLTALGLTREQATAKLDTGTIQTRRGPRAGAARGGRMGSDGRVYRDGGGWIGSRGLVGMDTVPAMLAPGEAVLNRHQQAVIEGMLGGGFLDRLFSRVSTPHFMAKGGIVPVPGFPGESAASSVIPKILQIARQFGLTLTDAFGPGHKSPGHTQFGTAADFAGPDASMDRAVAALVRAGYTVGYDGRFGSAAWPGHGPSSVAGSNAHLHVELGGGGGALASGVKIPRMVTGLGGGLGALVQRGLDRVRGGAQDKASAALSSLLETPVGGGGTGGGNAGNRSLGRRMLGAFGFGGGQFSALDPLWQGESGWNHLAKNPSSGAYGIPQALPGSKMASAGGDWQTNPATQIKWGLGYIRDRYGSPAKAYQAWRSRSPHWYARGGLVQRFAKGGRAGFEFSQSQTSAAAGAAAGRAKSAYEIGRRTGPGKGRNRPKVAIAVYEGISADIDRLSHDYEVADRRYGQTDEVLLNDDGSLNTDAIGQRVTELDALIELRDRILGKVREAAAAARRIVESYREVLRRLTRSLRTATNKDRKGIRAQIGTVQEEIGAWLGVVDERDRDVQFAELDLQDLRSERAEVAGTTARADSASDTSAEGAATPEQIAQGVAEQMATFQAARADLFSNFGSNYTLAGGALVPNDPTGQAAGLSHFGALTSGAGGGMGGGVTKIVNQTNNFPTPPPDPHHFARLTLFDLQAAP